MSASTPSSGAGAAPKNGAAGARLERLLPAVARFGYRRHRSVLFLAGLLTLASPFLLRGLQVDGDASRLLPKRAPLGQALRESRRLFGEANPLVFRIRLAGARSEAHDAFTLALAQELGSWPDIVWVDFRPYDFDSPENWPRRLRAAVQNGDDGEFHRFLERFEPAVLRRELLRSRRRLLTLDDPALRRFATGDLLDVRPLIAAYDRASTGGPPPSPAGGFYDAPDGASRLLFAQPRGPADDAGYAVDLMRRVDRAVADLQEGIAGAGPLSVEATGPHAITGRSVPRVLSDLRRITLAAAFLLLVLLLVSFARLLPTLLCFFPLIVSLLTVLVIVRFAVGPIHYMTIGFTAIFIGLGLDAGLHLMARFASFLGRHPPEAALAATYAEAGPPILIGTTTTAAAFLSLLAVRNQGMAQLGVLTTLGLGVTLVITLLVFPALVRLFASRLEADLAHFSVRWLPAGLLDRVFSRPRTLLFASVALTLASLITLGGFRFDTGILAFIPERSRPLQVAGEMEGTWGTAFAATTLLTLHSESPAGALAAQQRLDRELKRRIQQGEIAAFESPARYLTYSPGAVVDGRLPTGAGERVRQARPHFSRLLEELRFRGDPRIERYYDLLERAATLEDALPAVLAETLEHPRMARFLARDQGVYHLQTYVWPRGGSPEGTVPQDPAQTQTEAPLDFSRPLALSRELRGLPMPTGVTLEVTGLVEVYNRASELMLADFQRVSWIGLLVVTGLMVFFFRGWRTPLLCLLPLAAVVPVTAAAVTLVGIPASPMLVSFIAIVVGVGIDDAVHIVARVRAGLPIEDVVREIAPIIAFTTLSTGIGFGVLSLSSLAAVAGLGKIVAIGVVACWVFTVTLLAPLISLRRALGGVRAGIGALALGCLLLAGSVSPLSAESVDAAAEPILERLERRYRSTEAYSFDYRQSRQIEQLEGEAVLRGSVLFQRPHYLKAELSGDLELQILVDGTTLWMIDRDLGEVETLTLTGDRARHLVDRLLPPMILEDPAELRTGLRIVRLPDVDGRQRLEMKPLEPSETGFSSLLLEIGTLDQPRRTLLVYPNGDRIETEFQSWRRLERISPHIFEYRAGPEDPPGADDQKGDS